MTNKGKKYKTKLPKAVGGRKPLGGGWVEIRGKAYKVRTVVLSYESECKLLELSKENGMTASMQISNDVNNLYEGGGN